MYLAGLLALGIAAGALSGLTGMGGGTILVPVLLYVFRFSIHEAQGTTLALMVPPIGLVAAYEYFQKGYVNVTAAVLIALGFLAGSVFGAKLEFVLPADVLRRVFALLLLAVAMEMLMKKA
ncbi:MAG: sulfite exporter TauE/SafE family protein [Hyphomicrobiales bacterium]|nr:sulfite exporter TauE/SafE family protein [Hyphomicrobiales bacterium]